MPHTDARAASGPIDPGTRIGALALSVANLERSIAFYTEALGFAVLDRTDAEATLGRSQIPLLRLQEQPAARPWTTEGMTGLYHGAILLPSRADLGLWLGHYLRLGYPPPGQGDHFVSEALYLRDPDGHGLEIYADRPRSTWIWEKGRIRMGVGPVDLRGLLAEAQQSGRTWSGLPEGTTIGHIHLQVGDIAQAQAFYHDVLGFDVVATMPSALFVSAGGYHHHLGLNTWHSLGASPAPADSVTLRYFSLVFRSLAARAEVAARLTAAGIPFLDEDHALIVHDPWQNEVRLIVAREADIASSPR